MCFRRFKIWPVRNQNKIDIETIAKLCFMNRLLEMRNREYNFEIAIAWVLWAILSRVTLMKFRHSTLYKKDIYIYIYIYTHIETFDNFYLSVFITVHFDED